MLFVRERAVFAELGLRFRRNVRGFVAYFLCYQLLMSPTSVAGFAKALAGTRRAW